MAQNYFCTVLISEMAAVKSTIITEKGVHFFIFVEGIFKLIYSCYVFILKCHSNALKALSYNFHQKDSSLVTKCWNYISHGKIHLRFMKIYLCSIELMCLKHKNTNTKQN